MSSEQVNELGASEMSGQAAATPVEHKPLTWDRIRRGIARRVRNRTLDARDAIFLPIAGVSGRLASLFYATVSAAFGREHRAVVHGIRRYKELTRTASQTNYQLRRNVHRLEKGLIMRPRRPVFAADYIGQTVTAYRRVAVAGASDPALVDPDELRWAHDVLAEYFAAVGHDRAVDRARSEFASAPDLEEIDARFIPYRRALDEEPPIGVEALMALAHRRRSVRWFLPLPVPHDLVDRALEVAAQSPSACNRQPFEFRIFDDPPLVRTIAAVPLGTKGFADNLPMIAVVVGRLHAFRTERDRHLIYIDGGLAVMSFILALEAEGLSSCCINWADLPAQERDIMRILNLQQDERVVMMIGIGYPDPDGLVPYSQKKPLDLLRRYNAV